MFCKAILEFSLIMSRSDSSDRRRSGPGVLTVYRTTSSLSKSWTMCGIIT
ncbi:hypothetical protein Plhal304r1_c026g0087761 [Plasmopara halstedii]